MKFEGVLIEKFPLITGESNGFPYKLQPIIFEVKETVVSHNGTTFEKVQRFSVKCKVGDSGFVFEPGTKLLMDLDFKVTVKDDKVFQSIYSKYYLAMNTRM